MKQLDLIVDRLKKPSVLISLVSQIVALLMLFDIQVNTDLINGAIASICSILVMLGIVSDPDTENTGFKDDIYFCKDCGKESQHVVVGGQMICKDCGHVNSEIVIAR